MFFWSKKNVGKEGENVPIEYRYILSEPMTHKSFFDFLVLFRWTWGIFITISAVVFFFAGWIPAAIVFVSLLVLWFLVFRFLFKKFENSINLAKDEFKKLYQTIFGH